MKSSGKNRARAQGKALFATADRLHSAAIHLLRLVRKQDALAGVGPAQLSALSLLVFGSGGDAMTPGQLATAEQVKPPTMTRIVTGLERSGLAGRVSDPGDARRVQIRATGKGERLIMKGRQRRIEYLAKHLDALGEQELATLQEATVILEKVLLR